MIRRAEVLGARVDAGSRGEMLERILRLSDSGKPSRVLFANVHMAVLSRSDPRLREAMEGADLVCPDGMPLVRLLSATGAPTDRCEGMGAFPDLLALARERSVPVALVGPDPSTLAAVDDRIRRNLPGLRLCSAFPLPHGEELERRAPEDLLRIRGSGARLVFVALGCPRQERWIHAVRDVPACFLGVGNAPEVYAGLRRRAPRWARPLCLEWLFRLAAEPRRLGPRYLSTNLRFLLALPGWALHRRRGS